MNRKYLAFDIETAKILPEDFGELLAHRPLGICCLSHVDKRWRRASTFLFQRTRRHSSRSNDPTRLIYIRWLPSRSNHITDVQSWRWTDWDLTLMSSPRNPIVGMTAGTWHVHHVDMLFHIFCEKGFGVGLNAAAKGNWTEQARERWWLSRPTIVEGWRTSTCS